MPAAHTPKFSTAPQRFQARAVPHPYRKALPRLALAALCSALAVLALRPTPSLAQSAANLPITAQQRAIADQTAAQGVPLSELSPNAPSSHTVVRGDTLWDISGKFLKSPWRWPQLWGMNKAQIANPHLIYPGQVLYLIRKDGRAYLSLSPDGNDNGRLSPRVRSEDLAVGAIPSIPAKDIEPFLKKPLVLEKGELDNAARIIKNQEDRVFLGRGDMAYVRGMQDPSVINWQIYQAARKIRDPESNDVIAYESDYLGTLRLTSEPKPGDEVAMAQITEAKQEVGVGNHLLPVPNSTTINYVPHAPSEPVAGQIAATVGGVRYSGRGSIVVLNRGKEAGLEIGHVLALYNKGGTARDPAYTFKKVELPDQRFGLAFVFRVYDKVAYALIMQAELPVKVGDTFTQP